MSKRLLYHAIALQNSALIELVPFLFGKILRGESGIGVDL